MKNITILSIILLMVFAVSCSDQKAPTRHTSDYSVTLSKSVPENSGIVFRNNNDFIEFFRNPDLELVSLHSTRNTFLSFCEQPTEFEIITHQDVITPAGPRHHIDIGGGRLFTKVYGPAKLADFFADPCGFIANGPLLAEGKANFIYEDNSLTGEGPGANSWGWNAEGPLDDVVNGGSVHFNLHWRLVLQPNGEFAFPARVGPTLTPDPRD